jgi:hypothetical protein
VLECRNDGDVWERIASGPWSARCVSKKDDAASLTNLYSFQITGPGLYRVTGEMRFDDTGATAIVPAEQAELILEAYR